MERGRIQGVPKYWAHHAVFFAIAQLSCYYYYRAMHYSAKCGIATACRPSVRLSVTLVDQNHIV